ncbi:MAG: alpha/beta fold hydrolase [Phycisphaerae bacterium]
MSKAVVKDITMHYQAKGEGSDVVLVHGLTANMAFWYNTKVYPVLSRSYRSVAYDLRGHGYSELTPNGYTSRDLAGDLLALLDHLGIDKPRIIGHSFGGSVALHFAQLYPDRTSGVILCDTGFAALRHLRRIKEWSGWETWKEELPKYGITYEWFEEADAQGIKEVLSKTVDIPVQFGMRKGGRRDLPRFHRLLDETSLSTDFRDPAGLNDETLAGISPPVLAMYGENSPFRNVAYYLADTLENCCTYIVPKLGHFFLLQNADAFLERIDPFLQNPADYVQQAKAGRPDAGQPTDEASANGKSLEARG